MDIELEDNKQFISKPDIAAIHGQYSQVLCGN